MNKGTLFCTLLTLGVILFSANYVFAQGPCSAPYTYDDPSMTGGTWCCRTVGFTGCSPGETVNVSGDCCKLVTAPFLVPIPVANGYDNPLLAENIVQFTWQAITFLFTASLYFAVLMIIIGSYVMVTSGGIPSKIDKGKKIVIWTLVAVAIIIASRGIIELVWLLLGKQ